MAATAAVERAQACDLCGGDAFELVSQRDRDGAPLATCICARCGLVVQRAAPSSDELAAYYAGPYREQYQHEQTPSARRVLRSWEKGHKLLRWLQPHLKPGQRVLEVGAGVGCVVKVFELAGYEASGIDPGGGYLRFGTEQLGAALTRARLEDLPGEGRYDLVLLVHVIEHLRSPREALERLHALLAPRGLLYIECPNLGAPSTRWPKAFHRAHIHDFTTSSLTMLARRCGFRIETPAEDQQSTISVLYRRTEERSLEIDAGNYARILQRREAYDPGSYFLRGNYFRRRYRTLRRQVRERLLGGLLVRRIIKRCQAHGA
ncbi:MAG: class I SAM-dependent methyltransferase [Planctomycetota bacterium]|nr:class I SAM-dependent methyltransferase [Planctomycetota bacterium]